MSYDVGTESANDRHGTVSEPREKEIYGKIFYIFYYLREKIMFSSAFVCLSVCLFVRLLARLLKKLWMDFDEIFRKCQKCNEEQLIRFW